MIPLDQTLVLQANNGGTPSGTEPVALVGAKTVPAATKATFEDYQSRLTRTVIPGTAAVTICAAPTENAFKAVEYVGIWNGSSGSLIIYVSVFNGTLRSYLVAATVPVNQGLYYESQRGWYVF